MRLLLVITDYGGFNNFLSELCIHLLKNNIEIHVVCSKDKVIDIPDKFSYDGLNITFHIIPIPRKPSISGQFKVGRMIRGIIDEVKPDLVHAHFTTGTFPTVLFKNRSVPYWSTIHGLGLNSTSGLRKFLFTAVELFCFLRLDKIFVLNAKDYNLVNKYFPKKVSKYNSYGIGCDIEKFDRKSYGSEQLIKLKTALNIQDQFVIAYTGRYVAFKGFDILYHTFKKLDLLYPGSYKLLIMGGTDDLHVTGLSTQDFEALNQDASIINIGYTGEVAKYLSISNVFLFPSKKEGLPTCIVEALSIGLPVITMNERGNSDIIRNDYNGYLVESNNFQIEIDNLSKAIHNLRINPDNLERFSKNALNDRPLYSRSVFIDEHLKLYGDFFKSYYKSKFSG